MIFRLETQSNDFLGKIRNKIIETHSNRIGTRSRKVIKVIRSLTVSPGDLTVSRSNDNIISAIRPHTARTI